MLTEPYSSQIKGPNAMKMRVKWQNIVYQVPPIVCFFQFTVPLIILFIVFVDKIMNIEFLSATKFRQAFAALLNISLISSATSFT